MVDIPASYVSWSSLSVQQFARDLVVTLALYLATTIAELLQNVLTQKSRGLVDEESAALLTPKYWMQPISPPQTKNKHDCLPGNCQLTEMQACQMNRWSDEVGFVFPRIWLAGWWQLKLFFVIFQPYFWGFPKIGCFPPKSSILIGFSIINHPFWGTLIFGNTHLGKIPILTYTVYYNTIFFKGVGSTTN